MLNCPVEKQEHGYGLPEAMFVDRRIQDYPADYNYNNEQHRFAKAGRLWQQAAKPGSKKWAALLEDVAEMVRTEKERRGIAPGIMPIVNSE